LFVLRAPLTEIPDIVLVNVRQLNVPIEGSNLLNVNARSLAAVGAIVTLCVIGVAGRPNAQVHCAASFVGRYNWKIKAVRRIKIFR
jgi:hypothetical protein